MGLPQILQCESVGQYTAVVLLEARVHSHDTTACLLQRIMQWHPKSSVCLFGADTHRSHIFAPRRRNTAPVVMSAPRQPL